MWFDIFIMKISVVMALYNGSRFILEQMLTILEQTRLPDEVYFSDDGSRDNTVEIVQDFINEHNLSDSWHIHVNEQNKGYAKNFLNASMAATGEIIFFSDQDDLWLPDKIEKMSVIMANNSKINLLCSNLEPFYTDKNTRKWSKKDLADMRNDGVLEYRSITGNCFHIGRSGCTMCVRKSFLEKIITYWTSGWAHDDFVWKMAMLTDSIAVYQYVTLKRRMHSNNTTVIRVRTKDHRIKQLNEMSLQLEAIKCFCKDNDITDSKKINIIEKNIRSVSLRLKVVKNKSICSWIRLFFCYRDCYPRIKGLYLDLYLALFGTYKGV